MIYAKTLQSYKNQWLARYVAAVAAVGAGLLLRVTLTAWVGPDLPTYITFYPAIMAVALLGGLGPGLLATAATLVVVDFWVVTPGGFGTESLPEAVGMGLFSIMGLFMTIVAELFRRARHKAAAYEREAALRESEGFKQAILDSLPAHVAVIDERGIVLAVNESWQEFGRENGELQAERVSVGSDYLGVCRRAAAAADSLAREALEGIEGVLAGRRREFTLEYPCHSPTQQRWFLMSVVRPIGDVRGAVVMHLDISERKGAGEELRRREERLRFALETSHSGAWELDLGDHSAQRSLEHDRIFGYAELLPRWTYEMFLDHVLPEGRPMVDGKFRRAVETGGDWSFECRIRRADQQVRWIWAAGRHRTDAAGIRRGMTGIVQDITERKQAEESQARLAAIVESSDDAILSKDLGGTITSWNVGAERLFGYRSKEVIGRSIRMLLPPDRQDEEDQIMARLESGERVAHFETIRLTKDGRSLAVSVTASPLADRGGRIIGASKIFRDITQRKQPEQAVKQLNAELRQRVADLQAANAEVQASRRAALSLTEGALEARKEAERVNADLQKANESLGASRRATLNLMEDAIRARKQAEQASAELRQSEERYRGLVELSPEALFVNRNGRIVLVNPAALQLFGASNAEQLLGKSPFEVFHRDCHAMMRERISQVLAGQRVPVLEKKVVRLDGVAVDVEVVAAPVMD